MGEGNTFQLETALHLPTLLQFQPGQVYQQQQQQLLTKQNVADNDQSPSTSGINITINNDEELHPRPFPSQNQAIETKHFYLIDSFIFKSLCLLIRNKDVVEHPECIVKYLILYILCTRNSVVM